MKPIRTFIFLFFILLSCGKEEAILDNPLDPEGGDYEVPIVNLIADFVDGQTIDTETISFEISGNELVREFRYKLDENAWSQWSEIGNVTIGYLDEGDHQISVQSRYVTGDESEISTISFTVDAVSGPALMFYPRLHYAQQSQSVMFQIMAEEVQNLAGLEIVLDYDPSKVFIESVAIGTIFTEFGDPIFITDQSQQGHLTIISAVWGQGSPSFTGTGYIAEITIRVEQAGSIAIQFDGTEIFRDQNNSLISIQETIPGLVIVN